MAELPNQLKVFLCFERDLQLCADKVNQWPITNADFAAYNGRIETACDDPASEPARRALSHQLNEADVLVCFIASMHPDPWILWELQTAKAAGKGLVGILLKDYLEPPGIMRDCGAVFIPFKKDKVEQAVAFAAEKGRDLTEDYELTDE